MGRHQNPRSGIRIVRSQVNLAPTSLRFFSSRDQTRSLKNPDSSGSWVLEGDGWEVSGDWRKGQHLSQQQHNVRWVWCSRKQCGGCHLSHLSSSHGLSTRKVTWSVIFHQGQYFINNKCSYITFLLSFSLLWIVYWYKFACYKMHQS